MNLVQLKLLLWEKQLLRNIIEYNRIIDNCNVKILTKEYKLRRKDACKMIIEIREAIEVLNNN